MSAHQVTPVFGFISEAMTLNFPRRSRSWYRRPACVCSRVYGYGLGAAWSQAAWAAALRSPAGRGGGTAAFLRRAAMLPPTLGPSGPATRPTEAGRVDACSAAVGLGDGSLQGEAGGEEPV